MPQDAIVVVKRGPDGALASVPMTSLSRRRPPCVKVVDTIGAGDVFNAAFLAALAHGQTLATCLAAGVRVASRHLHSSAQLCGAACKHYRRKLHERA